LDQNNDKRLISLYRKSEGIREKTKLLEKLRLFSLETRKYDE